VTGTILPDLTPGDEDAPAPESIFEPVAKKGRGMAKESTALIRVMYEIAKATQPITGRGIGYKLFARGLIPSMGKTSMQKVYRLLVIAREKGIIPWHWIVDETRGLERLTTWRDPAEYAEQAPFNYRRDWWDEQPHRVEIWSEKGTVRGLLNPVFEEYAVGFRVMHGFTSSTEAHDIAWTDDSCDLIAIYVGDYDPSGLCMSERDLPARLVKYEGQHVKLRRIALTREQAEGRNLLSFPVSDKRKDPRYNWFVANYGQQCWELDAMDPNDLRNLVETEIKSLIDEEVWQRSKARSEAEQQSLELVLQQWQRDEMYGRRPPQIINGGWSGGPGARWTR
jgi:hypothetical protein